MLCKKKKFLITEVLCKTLFGKCYVYVKEMLIYVSLKYRRFQESDKGDSSLYEDLVQESDNDDYSCKSLTIMITRYIRRCS